MAVTIGTLLTVTPGEWQNDPTVIGNWQRDSENISGATQLTYLTTADDAGTDISYRETAINSSGVVYASSGVIEVEAGAVVLPTVDTAASITYGATVKVGSVITGVAGEYTNEVSVTMRWTRDGVTISGATGSTYTVVAADVGTSIRYVETAINADGSVESSSAAVIPTSVQFPSTGLRLTVDMSAQPATAAVARTGTNGTYVNSVGTLVVAAANTPRYHYKSGTFQGLYVEKSKTNLMPAGNNMGVVPPWTKLGTAAAVTVTPANATGPTGVALTATRLQVAAGNAGSGIRFAITSGASGSIRNSVYGRSRTGAASTLMMRHPANGTTAVTFNTTWTRVDLVGENAGGVWFNNDFTAATASAVDVELFGSDVTPGGADYDSILLSNTTRPAESLTITPGLSGTNDVLITFDNNSTQTIRNAAFTGGAWTVSAGALNRPLVKSVKVYSVGTAPAEAPAPTAVSSQENGMWLFKADILGSNGIANLQTLVTKGIFNVYVNVGFPSPAQGSPTFPELSGFVPDSEIGFIVSQSEAQQMKARLAQVDSRLKLWAWFGSYSTAGTGDLDGHFLAKMSVNTVERRTAIINACLSIMSGGHFYGAQDDNEDFKADSLESNGQYGTTVNAYFNEFAAAFKAAGYPVHTFVPSGWYNYNNTFLSGVTEPTAIIIAGHGHNGSMTASEWKSQTQLFFQNAQRPILYNFGYSSILTAMVDGLEAYPLSSVQDQIAGYTFYDIGYWGGQWPIWDNWPHKTVTSGTAPTPPPPPPPATTSQDWLAVAQTDMRKADGSYSGYINGRANNDAEWYLRNYVSFSSQSFNGQLTMGRYPDPRAFTNTNPDYSQELSYVGSSDPARTVSLWNRIIFWAQLCLNADFSGTTSKHANGYTGNSRVMMYDAQIWMKRRSTGAWVRIWSGGIGGEAWRPHFRAYSNGGYSGTSYTAGGGMDFRTESTALGGHTSFRTVPAIGLDSGDTSLSSFGKTVIPSYWVQHPYGGLVNWDAGDCADIVVSCKTSLVLHDTNGTDDRQYHRAMIQVGADYYAPSSTGGAGGGSYLYGVGTSRAKIVSAIYPAFQYHVMHTKATRADIATDHPPIS